MNVASNAWYRAPVVWFGLAILSASIAGCALLIVLALRYPDPPVQLERETVLKIPESRDSDP